MVPPGAIALTICSTQFNRKPSLTRDTIKANFAPVVAALNAGSRQLPKFTCDGGGLARQYDLVFHYADGPDVTVAVGPDCQPSITNGRILANNTDDVVAVINRLIRLR
jgi:hypothetical protein